MVTIKYKQVELPCSGDTVLLCCKGSELKLSGLDGELRSPFDPAGIARIGEANVGVLEWQGVGTATSEATYAFQVDAELPEWDGEFELEEDPYPKIEDCLFYMAHTDDIIKESDRQL